MTVQPPKPTPCPKGLEPEEWARAEQVLLQAPFAFFSMIDRGRPYVVPMNFAYEAPSDKAAQADAGGAAAGRLFFHTGPGRKSASLARDPHVCVAVTTDETFVQGATPCADGYAFRSVLVEGPATLVTNEAERERALRVIVGKYDPAAVDEPLDERVLKKTLVYEVAVVRVSYRRLPG